MYKILKLNYLLSFIIIIFIAWTNVSFAQSNTYNRMLNTSSKVVRGKIVGSEEVRYNYDEDNQNIVCGFILDIEVTESFKGGEENFRVFASNKDMLIGDDHEYFIIARRNNNAGNTPKVAFINCFDGKSTRMDTSYIPYLATSLRQQIFPIVSYRREDNIIDPDTRVAKKGDWLLLVDRIANNALPYTIARRRFNNGNEEIIEEMRFSDFLKDFNIK